MKFSLETGQPRFKGSYRVRLAHAADASSVFGQRIFGKPCFWQSIVWQTEPTENLQAMLLDIIRNFCSLTSYVIPEEGISTYAEYP